MKEQKFTIPGIKGVYTSTYFDKNVNEVSDIEKFYLIFYEPYFNFREIQNPTKDEVVNFFKNIGDDDAKTIEDHQEGFGAPLISMIARLYGYETIIEIFHVIKRNRKLSKVLFYDMSENSEHLIEHLCNIDEVFKIIDIIYNRNFNLIHEVSDQTDPSSWLDYMLQDDDLKDELIELLKKYNVQPCEFDFDLLED